MVGRLSDGSGSRARGPDREPAGHRGSGFGTRPASCISKWSGQHFSSDNARIDTDACRRSVPSRHAANHTNDGRGRRRYAHDECAALASRRASEDRLVRRHSGPFDRSPLVWIGSVGHHVRREVERAQGRRISFEPTVGLNDARRGGAAYSRRPGSVRSCGSRRRARTSAPRGFGRLGMEAVRNRRRCCREFSGLCAD